MNNPENNFFPTLLEKWNNDRNLTYENPRDLSYLRRRLRLPDGCSLIQLASKDDKRDGSLDFAIIDTSGAHIAVFQLPLSFKHTEIFSLQEALNDSFGIGQDVDQPNQTLSVDDLLSRGDAYIFFYSVRDESHNKEIIREVRLTPSAIKHYGLRRQGTVTASSPGFSAVIEGYLVANGITKTGPEVEIWKISHALAFPSQKNYSYIGYLDPSNTLVRSETTQ
ncbi:hypothetical protein KC721_01080 [Candidatus Woesebacteria bacterium]|nr:hypothetical protein [Candidatus Woesebacteria bacterium]